MRIAIVTGASSGLGREFVKSIDRTMELDEIWLIARREERLQALAGELRHKGRVMPMDLTAPDCGLHLTDVLRQMQAEVSILVCAAGFGKFGRAEDLTVEETNDMINLNCRAAVDVTRACIPFLYRGSRVLEICSCAGFQPLQGMNLYAATKAFLLSYTRALRWELAGRGVRVTAVCPSWVKTEFMQVARQTQNANAVGHYTAVAQKSSTVANWALGVNRLNFPVATCGPIAFIQRIGAKFLPNGIVMAAWELLRRV